MRVAARVQQNFTKSTLFRASPIGAHDAGQHPFQRDCDKICSRYSEIGWNHVPQWMKPSFDDPQSSTPQETEYNGPSLFTEGAVTALKSVAFYHLEPNSPIPDQFDIRHDHLDANIRASHRVITNNEPLSFDEFRTGLDHFAQNWQYLYGVRNEMSTPWRQRCKVKGINPRKRLSELDESEKGIVFNDLFIYALQGPQLSWPVIEIATDYAHRDNWLDIRPISYDEQSTVEALTCMAVAAYCYDPELYNIFVTQNEGIFEPLHNLSIAGSNQSTPKAHLSLSNQMRLKLQEISMVTTDCIENMQNKYSNFVLKVPPEIQFITDRIQDKEALFSRMLPPFSSGVHLFICLSYRGMELWLKECMDVCASGEHAGIEEFNHMVNLSSQIDEMYYKLWHSYYNVHFDCNDLSSDNIMDIGGKKKSLIDIFMKEDHLFDELVDIGGGRVFHFVNEFSLFSKLIDTILSQCSPNKIDFELNQNDVKCIGMGIDSILVAYESRLHDLCENFEPQMSNKMCSSLGVVEQYIQDISTKCMDFITYIEGK